jgi:hypothetical protein
MNLGHGQGLAFGLPRRFFRQALLILFFLSPFYYLPYYLSPTRGDITFGGEGFWLRAGKDLVVLGIVVVWLCRVALKGKVRVKSNWFSVAVLGYVTFGLLRSFSPHLEDVLGVLRLFVEYTIFFFIAQDTFSDEIDIRTLLWAWILPSIVVSLLGVYEYFSGGINKSYSMNERRIISTLYNPNALGWYLAWVNALALGMFLSAKSKKSSLTLLFIVGLNGGAIVLSGSRSALIVWGGVIILALLLSRRLRGSWVILMALAGTLMFIILAQSSPDADQLRVLDFTSIVSLRAEAVSDTLPFIINDELAILFGKGNLVVDSTSLMVDSQYINIFYSGGIVGAFLLSLVLSSVSALAIGLAGSFFIHFPLAMFFWSSLGLANRLISLPTHSPQAHKLTAHIRGH